jgi:predicted glycosyltransferase involved in capsule biosynthesis
MPNIQENKRILPGHIILKTLRIWNKERILKSVRQGIVAYKGKPITIMKDFSTKILKVLRLQNYIFKAERIYLPT